MRPSVKTSVFLIVTFTIVTTASATTYTVSGTDWEEEGALFNTTSSSGILKLVENPIQESFEDGDHTVDPEWTSPNYDQYWFVNDTASFDGSHALQGTGPNDNTQIVLGTTEAGGSPDEMTFAHNVHQPSSRTYGDRGWVGRVYGESGQELFRITFDYRTDCPDVKLEYGAGSSATIVGCQQSSFETWYKYNVIIEWAYNQIPGISAS
jgi:hypothetical protein